MQLLSENNFRICDIYIKLLFIQCVVSIFLVNIISKIFPLRLFNYLFKDDTFAYDENISLSKPKRHYVSNGLIEQKAYFFSWEKGPLYYNLCRAKQKEMRKIMAKCLPLLHLLLTLPYMF